MVFDSLADCIEANKKVEKDPRGYCIKKFPKLAPKEKKAALVSTTNKSTQVKPILCKKDEDLAACKQSGISKKTAKLKIQNKIAHLQIIKGKIKTASTSQDNQSPDGTHYTLTSLKRKGYPVHQGIMQLASQDSKFAKYYLLDSQDINGNGWGVTEESIKQNIKTFVDMPFVITAREWIEDSPYEDQFDHPFIPGNDLRSIFAHQEKFRVGTIVKVAKEEDNGKWYAMIKINPKFAHLNLPPFCSPALYQIDPHEVEGNMTKWIGLHLAGLMSDPAYGPRVAILRGACVGNGTTCKHQFKMAKFNESDHPRDDSGESISDGSSDKSTKDKLEERVDEVIDRLSNPQNFDDFDMADPFKNTEKLRKELVELSLIIRNVPKEAKDTSSNAIKPVKQQDQSGLDITETDKIDSPLAEKETINIKKGSCECPVQISNIRKRLVPFMSAKQQISHLKKTRQKIADLSKIESVETIPPIPKVQEIENKNIIDEEKQL